MWRAAVRSGLAFALCTTSACDDQGSADGSANGGDKPIASKPSSGKSTTPKDQPASPALPEPSAPAPSPPKSADGGEPPSAPTEPPSPTPTVSPIERLAASKPKAVDPSKTAWGHYKAGRFTEAQPFFAQATLADRVAWKHPFNLACAAAQAGDEEVSKHALVEAVSRDGAAVPPKARKDGDLAAVRSKPWFQSVLRGEPIEPPKPPTPEPPAPGSPIEPAGDDDGADPDLADGLRVGPLMKALGSVSPLPKAKLAELRAALANHHGVRTVMRGSVRHDSGGETLAWAVYEYALFDQCLVSSTKKECRKKLRGDPDDEQSNQMKCTEQWLVRAHFTDSVKLGTPQKILEGACTLGKVRRMEVKDYDADGAPEVMVDVTAYRETEGFREGEVTEGGRFVRIMRLEGSPQFELAFSWITSDVTPTEDEALRFNFDTLNGDAHPDILLETVVIDGVSGPRFDDELFPNTDDFEEDVTVTNKPHLYDPKLDQWVVSKP